MAALRGFKRQALHAETLEFMHPITGEPVRNTAPVPEDMLHLMKVLREQRSLRRPRAGSLVMAAALPLLQADWAGQASMRDHAPWRGHLAGAVRAVQPRQPARGRW